MVVRNQIPGRPWVPGIVEEVQGPLTYLVRLDTGQIWKRHVDHVREVGVSNDEQISRATTDTEVFDVPIPTDNSSTSDTPSIPESASEGSKGIASSSISTNVDPSSTSDVPPRRYPQRTRKPNPRYS